LTIRRRRIEDDVEERVLTGMIVSDKVLRDTVTMIRKDSFQNPYAQTVARWIQDYYRQYRKSPQSHIQDIYNIEKNRLKDEESVLIASFLSKLSSKFEDEEKVNEDYLIDKATQFFKKRTLKTISEKMESFLELDKVEEAERELQTYKQISKDVSNVIDLLSDEELKKFFRDEANEANKLFRMPGKLGELIGDFERGTLVAVMAPAKRGKSFMLLEISVQAYFEKFNVLIISLEMDAFRMKRRFVKRITAFGDEAKGYVYPCFDCFRNQINSCVRPQRTNKIKLRNSDGEKPETFDPTLDYKPCDVCRGKNKNYLPETWFTVIQRQKRNLRNSMKVFQATKSMYGEDRVKLICYPKFSANVSQIKADIDTLEFNENFIPDVIVIDYADILAPEDGRLSEGRDRSDATWKMFGNLASTRRALVVTASQTNRLSFKKKNVIDVDVAEDIRKLANVEMMLSLSQTPEEKRQGLIRVAVVAGREDEFDQYKSCLVLQNLNLCQSYLDSEIVISDKEKKKLLEENKSEEGK
jgi:replicative DNA helicase